MKPQDLNAKSGNPACFPAVMAAVVAGVSKHGDLMRMAISSPGNDFRLGAMEAPPAVITTFLGDSTTKFLEGFMNGETGEYKIPMNTVSSGVDAIGSINVPAEDRNR